MKDCAYKIIIDEDGHLLKADSDFKADFPNVTQIKEKVRFFSSKELNAIKLPGRRTNQTLVCKAKFLRGGRVELKIDRMALFGNEENNTNINLAVTDGYEETYNTLIRTKERILMGEIYFQNLYEVMTVFGRKFTERVRNTVIDRIKAAFDKTFSSDYYHISVIYAGDDIQNKVKELPVILETFNKVVTIDDNLIQVSVKAGFAIVDREMAKNGFEYILTAISGALKRAEETDTGELLERKSYCLYEEIQKKIYSKYFFKIDIPKMLSEGDFYLEYQPQYDTVKNKIVGFEALFRVKKRVQITASVFDIIEYAEQSGNMMKLGDFIFNEGMKFAKSIEGKGVSVSLNISAIQLLQAGFVDSFMNIYRKYDLKPGSIALEIDESFLVYSKDETLKKLELLNANGIILHLDDFLMRYSSFNYLQKLPMKTVKIDRNFVKNICDKDGDINIGVTVLTAANSLHMTCIGEGVETMEQYDLLRKMGCNIFQGYLISKSVEENTAREMIDTFKFNPKK